LKNALNSSVNPEITTLITGSSYGAFGIDTSYIQNSVNLCSISQDLYYSKKLLLQACQNNQNIQNVVLCMGYYYFYSDLSLTQSPSELQRVSKVYYPLLHDAHNCLILPSKEDFCTQNGILNVENILDTYTSIECQKGFFNDSYPRIEYATKVWQDWTKNWSELTVDEQDEAGKIRAESHNKGLHHLASFKENIGHFQTLVNYCNTNGINLLIVVTPMTKHYLKYLDTKYKDDFYSILESTDGMIHLLDLAEDSSFENNIHFNDTDHLNDLGAAKLSSIISSTLDEIETF